MDPAWKTLQDAGVPDGAIRPREHGPLDAERLRAALRQLADGPALEDGRAEPLLAWLQAWRHHWPQRYRAILGPSAEELRTRLEQRPVDPNRYLKLRRIAIEALVGLL
jgi:hypothetical protein